MQTLPERPDVTPKKKRSKGAIAASVIGGLIVLGAISNLADSDTSTVDTPSGVTSTYEVTADLVVDTMGPEAEAQFCTYYAQLGDAASYTAFASGYGATQDPDAREVFDELVSRC